MGPCPNPRQDQDTRVDQQHRAIHPPQSSFSGDEKSGILSRGLERLVGVKISLELAQHITSIEPGRIVAELAHTDEPFPASASVERIVELFLHGCAKGESIFYGLQRQMVVGEVGRRDR